MRRDAGGDGARWLRLAGMFAALLLGALTAGSPRSARATSCVARPYVRETLRLTLVAVHEATQQVEAPAGLPRFATLETAAEGMGLELRGVDVVLQADFAIRQTLEPTLKMAHFLLATRMREPPRSRYCRAGRYTPLMPGVYRAGRRPDMLGWSEIVIEPGRRRVELRFGPGARRLRAVYDVDCAYFEADDDWPRLCGLSIDTLDLAAALAAARPVSGDMDYRDFMERLGRQLLRGSERPPASGARCELAAPTGPGVVVLLALMRRRRRFAGRAPARRDLLAR